MHAKSRRAAQRLRCGQLRDDDAGAHGGRAVRRGEDEGGRKIGLLELAHGGTLFLDEVSDMPLETQGKILRVLVDQTFQRVGGATRVQVDVRVISSSTRDLRQDIEQGRFREDLYHRLNVVPVRVPSLAERRDDIPLLVSHFMKRLSIASGLPMREIADEAMAALQAYHWPGNVRQLRNIVERLLILATDDAAEAITSRSLAVETSTAAPRPGARLKARTHHLAPFARSARDVSSANICSRRSIASAATSRAPQRSSAWSAPRCTAS